MIPLAGKCAFYAESRSYITHTWVNYLSIHYSYISGSKFVIIQV